MTELSVNDANPDDEEFIFAVTDYERTAVDVCTGTPSGRPKKDRKRARNIDAETNKPRSSKRKLLNKKQREQVMDSVRCMSLDLVVEDMKNLVLNHGDQKEIFDALIQDDKLMTALLKFHHTTFINLYTD